MMLKEMKQIRNDGLALPVILILLLVMTVLGVTSLSNSTLQERMTAGQKIRSTAFNFAETTLREGEAHAQEIAETIREGLLTTQGATEFRLFSTIIDDTHPKLGFPSPTTVNPGDSCTGGYCTPIEFDLSGTNPTVERWDDAAIWADTERHRVLEGFDAAALEDQDIFETPQYIIEFLGQLPVQETAGEPDSAIPDCGGILTGPNTAYPFCPRDPYFFRITSRVISGSDGRQSVVMLQSTIFVDL